MNKSKFITQIGKTIYKIRTEKNLSLHMVAKVAKISTNHLKNIENGNVDCHLRIIIRICDAMKINVRELFKEADKFS